MKNTPFDKILEDLLEKQKQVILEGTQLLLDPRVSKEDKKRVQELLNEL